MVISRETVEFLAGLAKIGLTDEEKERFSHELSCIWELVRVIDGAGTEGVASATRVAVTRASDGKALREDIVVPPPPREVILANAPEHDEACFITPKVLD